MLAQLKLNALLCQTIKNKLKLSLMTTEIKAQAVDPKEFGLEQNQVATIEQAFQPKIAERDGYNIIYQQLIIKELTPELCSQARELRLKLVKTRTGIAEIHKTQKAYFLAAGKFVDAWKNKETLPVEQMEEKLSDIEKHFERIEADRIAKLETERKEEIQKYSEIIPYGLGVMDEAVFNTYLTGVKVAYEARIKKEKEDEAERLRLIEVEKENARLKAIEDERIRKENEALKQAAIEAEKKAEAERQKQAKLLADQKAEAERKAKVEADRQAKIQADLKAKADAEKKAIEEKARIEREKAEAERKRLADELAAKEAKERQAKAEADRIEAERNQAELKAKKAPDKEKLNKMVESISITIPELKDQTAIATAKVINAKFEAFKAWAKTQIESV